MIDAVVNADIDLISYRNGSAILANFRENGGIIISPCLGDAAAEIIYNLYSEIVPNVNEYDPAKIQCSYCYNDADYQIIVILYDTAGRELAAYFSAPLGEAFAIVGSDFIRKLLKTRRSALKNLNAAAQKGKADELS